MKDTIWTLIAIAAFVMSVVSGARMDFNGFAAWNAFALGIIAKLRLDYDYQRKDSRGGR